MIRSLFVTVSLLLSAVVNAQMRNTADSFYFYRQDVRELGYIQENATQLLASGIERTGTAGLALETGKGHFRTAQQAEQQTLATLSTAGIHTLGRFRLSGFFRFSRSWEDSLAWTMKGMDNDPQPYYFIAGKSGQYQRLQYHMGAIIAYALIRDKLYLSTGVEYLYNSATRSVDPRPEVNEFKLAVSPELSWKWKQHTVGLGVTWGYGTETDAINYKNIEYRESALYPDRKTYLVMGYGNLSQTSERFRRGKDYSGIRFNYAGVAGSWSLRVALAYNRWEDNNYWILDNGNYDSKFSSYRHNTSSLNLLASRNTERSRQQVELLLQQQDGKDHNTEYGANNYHYSATTADIRYRYMPAPQGRTVTPELGAGLQFNGVYKRDAAAAHIMEYRYLQPSVNATIYWQLPAEDRLSVTLQPSLRMPLYNHQQAPASQVNYFTQGVMFPDHYYWQSSALLLQANATFITGRLFEQFRTGFSAGCTYVTPMDTPAEKPAGNFVPAGNRLHVNASFNLYF